ncbi:MAG: UvrB/UvrC motif-containing protein [Thermotogaceae bacterium]|nr:UvrB/UvrC motif-containing protein [Thermotogaceae bacterium]
MRCQRCGKEAEYVYKFHSDGIPKAAAYCKECLIETIKQGNEVSISGLKMLTAHATIVQEAAVTRKFEIGGEHSDVFIKMPVAVLRILFKKDKETDKRITKEIYERHIYLLKKRLDKAVENEDYKKASKIKEEIQKILHIMNNI